MTTVAHVLTDKPLSDELEQAIRICVEKYGGVVMVPVLGATQQVARDVSIQLQPRIVVGLRRVDTVQYLRFDCGDMN